MPSSNTRRPQPRATLTRKSCLGDKFSGFCFKIQANLDDHIMTNGICSHYVWRLSTRHETQACSPEQNAYSKQCDDVSGSGSGCDRRHILEILMGSQSWWHPYWNTFTQEKALSSPVYQQPHELSSGCSHGPTPGEGAVKRLMELSEEGAASCTVRSRKRLHYRALGVLQFDVIASRLENEYRVRARFESVPLGTLGDLKEHESLRRVSGKSKSHLYRYCGAVFIYCSK